MSVGRIVAIAVGVMAACWVVLWVHGFYRSSPADSHVVLPTASDTLVQSVEATVASHEPPRLADAGSSEADFAQVPSTFEPPPDLSEPWGKSFEDCLAKHLVHVIVCKHRFELRDPRWAPEAEQRIRDFVADAGLLRLPAEDDPLYVLECRVTFCKVHLRVDRVGLAEYLRSVGRYPANIGREHEFARLTLSLARSVDGQPTTRWAEDRAEELRLALILAGLLEADSSVAVEAHEPAYREQDSYLLFELSRCPNLKELCTVPWWAN